MKRGSGYGYAEVLKRGYILVKTLIACGISTTLSFILLISRFRKLIFLKGLRAHLHSVPKMDGTLKFYVFIFLYFMALLQGTLSFDYLSFINWNFDF